MPEPTHVIDDDLNPAEALVWTMLCGEQCVAFDDGTLAPAGFDFYGLPHAKKASCQRCRRAAGVDEPANEEAATAC